MAKSIAEQREAIAAKIQKLSDKRAAILAEQRQLAADDSKLANAERAEAFGVMIAPSGVGSDEKGMGN